jgi:hypothetical protein
MVSLGDRKNKSDTERAYKKGAIAASNKVKFGDNPYHENSSQYWCWVEGFISIKEQLIK